MASCALCQKHVRYSFTSVGADSACRHIFQAHVVRSGCRQQVPSSFSSSDTFVNDRKGEQFCFVLSLEQLIPQDAPAHLADVCSVLLEKAALRLSFTSQLCHDVGAGRDKFIDLTGVATTTIANIAANDCFNLSQGVAGGL